MSSVLLVPGEEHAAVNVPLPSSSAAACLADGLYAH